MNSKDHIFVYPGVNDPRAQIHGTLCQSLEGPKGGSRDSAADPRFLSISYFGIVDDISEKDGPASNTSSSVILKQTKVWRKLEDICGVIAGHEYWSTSETNRLRWERLLDHGIGVDRIQPMLYSAIDPVSRIVHSMVLLSSDRIERNYDDVGESAVGPLASVLDGLMDMSDVLVLVHDSPEVNNLSLVALSECSAKRSRRLSRPDQAPGTSKGSLEIRPNMPTVLFALLANPRQELSLQRQLWRQTNAYLKAWLDDIKKSSENRGDSNMGFRVPSKFSAYFLGVPTQSRASSSLSRSLSHGSEVLFSPLALGDEPPAVPSTVEVEPSLPPLFSDLDHAIDWVTTDQLDETSDARKTSSTSLDQGEKTRNSGESHPALTRSVSLSLAIPSESSLLDPPVAEELQSTNTQQNRPSPVRTLRLRSSMSVDTAPPLSSRGPPSLAVGLPALQDYLRQKNSLLHSTTRRGSVGGSVPNGFTTQQFVNLIMKIEWPTPIAWTGLSTPAVIKVIEHAASPVNPFASFFGPQPGHEKFMSPPAANTPEKEPDVHKSPDFIPQRVRRRRCKAINISGQRCKLPNAHDGAHRSRQRTYDGTVRRKSVDDEMQLIYEVITGVYALRACNCGKNRNWLNGGKEWDLHNGNAKFYDPLRWPCCSDKAALDFQAPSSNLLRELKGNEHKRRTLILDIKNTVRRTEPSSQGEVTAKDIHAGLAKSGYSYSSLLHMRPGDLIPMFDHRDDDMDSEGQQHTFKNGHDHSSVDPQGFVVTVLGHAELAKKIASRHVGMLAMRSKLIPWTFDLLLPLEDVPEELLRSTESGEEQETTIVAAKGRIETISPRHGRLRQRGVGSLFGQASDGMNTPVASQPSLARASHTAVAVGSGGHLRSGGNSQPGGTRRSVSQAALGGTSGMGLGTDMLSYHVGAGGTQQPWPYLAVLGKGGRPTLMHGLGASQYASQQHHITAPSAIPGRLVSPEHGLSGRGSRSGRRDSLGRGALLGISPTLVPNHDAGFAKDATSVVTVTSTATAGGTISSSTTGPTTTTSVSKLRHKLFDFGAFQRNNTTGAPETGLSDSFEATGVGAVTGLLEAGDVNTSVSSTNATTTPATANTPRILNTPRSVTLDPDESPDATVQALQLQQITMTCYMGLEYECPLGHRFFLHNALNEHDPDFESAEQLAMKQHPLHIQCICSANAGMQSQSQVTVPEDKAKSGTARSQQNPRHKLPRERTSSVDSDDVEFMSSDSDADDDLDFGTGGSSSSAPLESKIILAQLMRIHIVTPPAPAYMQYNPRIRFVHFNGDDVCKTAPKQATLDGATDNDKTADAAGDSANDSGKRNNALSQQQQNQAMRNRRFSADLGEKQRRTSIYRYSSHRGSHHGTGQLHDKAADGPQALTVGLALDPLLDEFDDTVTFVGGLKPVRLPMDSYVVARLPLIYPLNGEPLSAAPTTTGVWRGDLLEGCVTLVVPEVG
eukprot:Clim_evm3s163 gene=Clim_evmTU3s163